MKLATVLAGAMLAGLLPRTPLYAQDQAEFFEKNVRPVFATRCAGCHNAQLKMGGLDLTNAAGFRKGAASGMLVEGARSRLLDAVRYEGKAKMPPAGKLPDREIEALATWIRAGAMWPETASGASKSARLWSFEPLHPAPIPKVRREAWARNDIDRFLLARMEKEGLEPAQPADRPTLLRRVTFDLTGLPPSEKEIADFENDESPGAFARVVDRLLSSPRYGERWGRHWMDVARYADSTGADEDHRYPHAWRYRDYVIDAFNQDLPYDRFVREQIAGDTLPATTPGGVNVQGIVATGFLALGPKLIAEQDKIKMFYDIVDEQIDVTGRAFLGLTLACARCHDHKFDPITTKDYYSLASIFASTKQLAKLEGTVSQLYFAPLTTKQTAEAWLAHKSQVDAKQKEIDAVTSSEQTRFRKAHAPRLGGYMVAARRVYQGGETAEQAAAATGLDAWVVSQWAKYLKPTGERRIYLEAWEQSAPVEREAVAREYQSRYETTARRREDAIEEWKKVAEAAKAKGEKEPEMPKFLPGDDRFFTEVNAAAGPFALPEKDRESHYSEESRTKLAVLRAELASLKQSGPPEPPLACSVAEGEPVEQRVFVRGNPEAKGDAVAKRFPAVLAGEEQPAIASGSGRRELADWIASPSNPLTARVMVNRIWQWHFGEGLVRTPSNFGKLGETPSHPELLDWLALRFIESGWSVKAMHRLILDSNAYRLSSVVTTDRDGENRLLSRFSRRRLSVEEIRDSLLTFDGSLDLKMGGSMQSGEGTDKEFSDDRKSLDPDRSQRRLVYLPLRRSNLPSLLNLFDFGDATTTGEGRTQTNVAPQALFMMNSPFVERQAKALAARLLGDTALDDAGRVERAWALVVNLKPGPESTGRALGFVRNYPGDATPLQRWTSFCRTLIASNDFLYVR